MTTHQKETPTSGSNHLAGVNTQNGPIVADHAASDNTQTADHLCELATASQRRLLAKASNFASLHAPHTLWKREMGTGAAKVLVRLEWPGVLCVYCPKSGERLAMSAPGAPETIQKI